MLISLDFLVIALCEMSYKEVLFLRDAIYIKTLNSKVINNSLTIGLKMP